MQRSVTDMRRSCTGRRNRSVRAVIWLNSKCPCAKCGRKAVTDNSTRKDERRVTGGRRGALVRVAWLAMNGERA